MITRGWSHRGAISAASSGIHAAPEEEGAFLG